MGEEANGGIVITMMNDDFILEPSKADHRPRKADLVKDPGLRKSLQV